MSGDGKGGANNLSAGSRESSSGPDTATTAASNKEGVSGAKGGQSQGGGHTHGPSGHHTHGHGGGSLGGSRRSCQTCRDKNTERKRYLSKSREAISEKVANSNLKKSLSKSRERLCDIRLTLSKSR